MSVAGEAGAERGPRAGPPTAIEGRHWRFSQCHPSFKVAKTAFMSGTAAIVAP